MEIYEFGMKQRKTTADSYRSFYLGMCTYIFFGSGGGLLTCSRLRQEHWNSECLSFFCGNLKNTGDSLVAQLIKNLPAIQETPVRFLGWGDLLEKDRLPSPVFLGFPSGSAGKEYACNVGDLGLIPVLGRSPGEGKGYLFFFIRASIILNNSVIYEIKIIAEIQKLYCCVKLLLL